MWKKIYLSCATFIAVGFTIFSLSNHIYASSTTAFATGGTITGTIGPLKRGDLISLRVKDSYNENMSFRLLAPSSEIVQKTLPDHSKTEAWICMGSPYVKSVYSYKNHAFSTTNYNANSFKGSDLSSYFDTLVGQLTALPIESGMLIERPNISITGPNGVLQVYQQDKNYMKFFTPAAYERGTQQLMLTDKDLAEASPYYLETVYSTPSSQWAVIDKLTGLAKGIHISTATADLRPFAILDFTDTVFAVSNGDGSAAYATVNEPLEMATAYLSTGDPMNIRFLDSSISTPSIIDVQRFGSTVSTVIEDSKIKISYTNSTAKSNHFLSLLVSDASGNLRHYERLKLADGSGDVEANLKGIPDGSYNLQLVVEEIPTDGENGPTYSSALSSSYPLTIVNPVNTITFTKTPIGQSTYEYTKNVSKGDVLGIIGSNGGIEPVTYKLVADPAHPSDVDKLELGKNAAGNTTVKVKETELGGGTYYFKVEGVDANTEPSPATISDVFSFKVEKTKQPDLKFYDSGDSSASVLTALNKDKKDPAFMIYARGGASAVNDSNITYMVKDSSTNIISSITGTGTSASVTLSGSVGTKIIVATKAGNDNYKPVSAELSVQVTENSLKPIVRGEKQDTTLVNRVYTSGQKYNDGLDVIVEKPTTGSLMLQRKTNKSMAWTDPSIASVEILDSDYISGEFRIPISLAAEEKKYEEFRVYLKNYDDSAHSIEFITNLYKHVPTISEVVDGVTYDTDISINLNRDVDNKLTADLNGRSYSDSITLTSDGTYTLKLTDEYGNTNGSGITFTLTKAGIDSFVFHQTTTLKYLTSSVDAGGTVGTLTPSGGTGPYTFSIDPAYSDGDYFETDPSKSAIGTVKIKKTGLTPKIGDYSVGFIVTDMNGKTANCVGTIKVDKAVQDDFASLIPTGETIQTINTTYKDSSIPLIQFKNPAGLKQTFDIEYKEKDGLSTSNKGIIKIDSKTGVMTTLKAGTTWITVTSKENNLFEEKAFDVKVVVKKAKQEFKFDPNSIDTYIGNPDFMLTPVGNDTTGAVTFAFSSGSPANGVITLNKSDGTIGIVGVGTTKVTAFKSGDDNYEDAEAQITINVLPKSANSFKFTETGPSKLMYGDVPFKVEASGGGGTGAITYSLKQGSAASVASDGTVTILHAGNIEIQADKAATSGYAASSTSVVLTIVKRPIDILVDSQKKKVGEVLDPFSYKETSTLKILSGDKDTAVYSSLDKAGNPITSDTDIGVYPITISNIITAEHADDYELNITDGKIEKYRDTGNKAWYEILGTLGDKNWYSSDVTVKMKTGADYDVFSQNESTWLSEFSLTTEGRIPFELYFKNSTTNALSDSITDEVLIDKTAPEIEQIKAKDSNNTLEQLLNAVTFGTFFKPGTKISIYTNDDVNNKKIEVSNTKEVVYSIYEIDNSGKETLLKHDETASANDSGVAKITLNNTGKYKVCAVPSDYAGNTGGEKCAKVSIKDPKKDYDPNDLGCPSVNITLGTGKPVLNIDTDLNGIPDMNIDTNGDELADINIDNDNDGLPDTNLVNLKQWNPTVCSTTTHSYGYMSDIKAKVNITQDTDKKIASLNIDTTGDFIADVNIDIDNNGTADVNIIKIHEWKPEKDFIHDEFQYDTMQFDLKKSLELNIDTDGDGRPDINLDTDRDGFADINIDTNHDWIPELNIDTDGDGKPDINIDENDDGVADKNIAVITTWKPEKDDCSYNGFQYDTMSNLVPDEKINNLKDNPTGIIVEQVNPENSFKKSQYIRVDNITNDISNSEMNKITSVITDSEQEVKKVLEAKLFEGNSEIQPDGMIKVKIPLTDDIKAMKNRKLAVQQKDGSYKIILASIEGDYLVYETDFLGKISFIADKDEVNTGGSTTSPIDNNQEKSVKGVSIVKGGAMTGDNTNLSYLIFAILSSIIVLMLLIVSRRKNNKSYE